MRLEFLLVTAVLLMSGLTAGERSADAQQLQPPPQLSISDVLTATEGRTGITTLVTFAVTLSAPSAQPVTVVFTTADPTPDQCAPFACATAGSDYVPTHGFLTFAPGETVKIITVPIINDDVQEPNKAFVTVLVNPTNAGLAKPVGVAKITNQRVPYQSVECATEISEGMHGNPVGFVLGPDGNFWMTDAFSPKLLMFDPRTRSGAEFPLPPFSFPHFINVGPDGNLWFTVLTDQIGSFDLTTRTASLFGQGITRGSVPHVILTGPDGNLYFTEEGSELIPDPLGRGRLPGTGRLGQFNPSTRFITEFSEGLPTGARIHGLEVGPDGNLWASLGGTDQIARFNLATKTFDQFVSFSRDSNPQNVLRGPDDNLYVTLTDSNRLGRYNPRTGEVREFATSLTREDGPSLIYFTVGPDRNSIWFTEFLNDRVGVFDIKTEQITEIDCGFTAGGGPIGIAVGPDNALWVSEVVLDPRFHGRLARLVPSATHRFTDANRGFVTSIYRDLLGREPDSAGLDYFSALLERGQANHFQVAQALENSREARIHAVQQTYGRLLGRSAEPKELAEAVQVLESGGQIDQVEATIINSPEYFSRRGGGLKEGFLGALYGDLLARAQQAGDQIEFVQSLQPTSPFKYVGQVDAQRSNSPLTGVPSQLGLEKTPERYPATFDLATAAAQNTRVRLGKISLEQLRRSLATGAPRSTIASPLLASTERRRRLVHSLYGSLLFRPADAGGLDTYTTALVRGVPADLVSAALIGSPEYQQRRVLGRP